MQANQTVFVLIHDAWQDAWAWDAVAARLLERGWDARVLTRPTSTADLPEQAAHLVEFAQNIDRPIVMVGHGTGGAIAQLASETLPNVAGVIFVAGYVLRDGESLASQMSPDIAGLFQSVADQQPEHLVELATVPDLWRFGYSNDAGSKADDWLARLVPETSSFFFDPIILKSFFTNQPACAYLSFNEDMSLPPGAYHPTMANKLGKYQHVNINAGHQGILTKGRETAEVLIYLASQF